VGPFGEPDFMPNSRFPERKSQEIIKTSEKSAQNALGIKKFGVFSCAVHVRAGKN